MGDDNMAERLIPDEEPASCFTMCRLMICPTIVIVFSMLGVLLYVDHLGRVKAVGRHPLHEDLSDTNTVCYFPPIDDTNFTMKRNPPALHCRPSMPDLFSMSTHGFLVPKGNRPSGYMRCTYSSLLDKHESIKPLSLDGPTLVDHSQVVARCTNGHSVIYEKSFVNFAAPPKIEKRTIARSSANTPSLLILTVDSVSLDEFSRSLPSTTTFMKRQGFVPLEKYNRQYDSRVANLRAVLLGNAAEAEDNRIWKKMNGRGCISLVSDDLLSLSNSSELFSSVDYFLQPTADFDASKGPTSGCQRDGLAPTAVAQLSTLSSFANRYSAKCLFALQHISGVSGGLGRVPGLDQKFKNTLASFFSNGVSENTVIVIMGDHGSDMYKNSVESELEIRTPMVSVHLPKGFRSAYPEETSAFLRNAKSITSNGDLHLTLRDIADGVRRYEDSETTTVDERPRGNVPRTAESSLFRPWQDARRDCKHLGIHAEQCLCMQQPYGFTSSAVIDSAHNLLRSFILSHNCFKETSLVVSKSTVRRFWPPLSLMPEESSIEYIYMKVQGHAVWTETGKNETVTILGHIRHETSTSSFSLVSDPRLEGVPAHSACSSVVRLAEYCRSCAGSERLAYLRGSSESSEESYDDSEENDPSSAPRL